MLHFFSAEEETRIIEAIRTAEGNTSGEIRVHIEKNCTGGIYDAAKYTFHYLKMDKTTHRNGVILFIAPERRAFAIYADKGINEVVPENFWHEERDILQQHFKAAQFADGVCVVVEQIGEKLKQFFPYQSDGKNELPDDISYG